MKIFQRGSKPVLSICSNIYTQQHGVGGATHVPAAAPRRGAEAGAAGWGQPNTLLQGPLYDVLSRTDPLCGYVNSHADVIQHYWE